jgi:hypothetical protein
VSVPRKIRGSRGRPWTRRLRGGIRLFEGLVCFGVRYWNRKCRMTCIIYYGECIEMLFWRTVWVLLGSFDLWQRRRCSMLERETADKRPSERIV